MPQDSDAAPRRDDYGWSTLVSVDPAYAKLQHVGNIEFAHLFNSARVALNSVLIERMAGRGYFGQQLIVHIGMDFAREVSWTAQLEIHARIGPIGRTSYDLELAVFLEDLVAVRCRTVAVWVKDGLPEPISTEAREVLMNFPAIPSTGN